MICQSDASFGFIQSCFLFIYPFNHPHVLPFIRAPVRSSPRCYGHSFERCTVRIKKKHGWLILLNLILFFYLSILSSIYPSSRMSVHKSVRSYLRTFLLVFVNSFFFLPSVYPSFLILSLPSSILLMYVAMLQVSYKPSVMYMPLQVLNLCYDYKNIPP